jgi:hypothetical protein
MVGFKQSFPTTERAILEEHLARAERHVAAGEEHINRQRRVVSQRRRQRLDAHEATVVLMQFESLQAKHVADRDRLREELGF